MPFFLPAFTPIVGDNSVWLSFFGSLIGAFASFVMIFFTAKTLEQNKQQLEELKRQWDEEHSPYLSCQLIPSGSYFKLRILNSANVVAKDVSIDIEKCYISKGSYICMTKKDDRNRRFRSHYAAMYLLAMMILRDDDAARDIVHDVFEALLVSEKSDVSASYLLTAVRNRWLKHIRSLSVQDRLKAAYSVENEIEEEEWPDDETIALIQSTVSNDLSGACRCVVVLRFSKGKSYQEIVAILGRPILTPKVKI